MLNILGLNKSQLKGFTTSAAFQNFEFAPISEFRELSHIHNPRAKEDDILLFLAYEENQLAGYLGLLPDDVCKDGEQFHFAWLSTILVSEKYRGKQIAQKLLYAAEEAYNGRLMITEFTESAARLYHKIGLFESLTSKRAVRYYFKSNLAEILPFKKAVFERNKDWLLRFDNLINPAIPYFSKSSKLNYTTAYQWDEELTTFVSEQQKNPISRASAEFSWMLKYPWLSTEKSQANYLFSSYAKSYKMFWVKLYDAEKLVACFLCSIRNGHLKILYYFTENAKIIADFLPEILKSFKVKMMTIYDDKLNLELSNKKNLSALYRREFERNYLISKKFLSELGENFDFQFTDGDGDFSFT